MRISSFFKSIGKDIYYPFRIFTFCCLSYLIGNFLANLLKPNLQVWPVLYLAITLYISLTFINFLFKNRLLSLISFSFIFLIIAFWQFAVADHKMQPINLDGSFEGIIYDRPERDIDNQKVKFKLEHVADNRSCLLDIKNIPNWHLRFRCVNKFTVFNESDFILLSLPIYQDYNFGDRLQISGKIKGPTNFSTGFDYVSYLKKQGIKGVMDSPEKVTHLNRKTNIKIEFYRSLFFFSEKFEQILCKIFPEPHASLASGILLGSKKNMPDDFKDQLNTVGLSHIVALSGYNITILIIILTELILMLFNRKTAFVFGLILVATFVLMTGASSSVVRAAFFSLLILLAKTIGRKADNINLILFTAVIMVLINPYVLVHDIGFQLSFLAFIGLMYLGPIIKNTLARFKKIPSILGNSISETLGAQLAVTPLIAWQFGKISLISPISNILVVWIIPYTMLLSFLVCLASMIYFPIGKVLAYLAWPTLEFLISAVKYLSNVPFASINI